MIRQRQLFWGLLFGAFLALIVTVAIYIKPSSLPNEEALPVSNGGTPLEPSSEKVTSVTDSSIRDSSQSTYHPSNWNKVTIKSPSPFSNTLYSRFKIRKDTDFYAKLYDGCIFP